MKRLFAAGILAVAMAAYAAPAQTERGEGSHEAESKSVWGLGEETWKAINFVILAAGLGYVIYKKAGAVFAARSAGIRSGIEESARLKQDADARYAETERLLAGIGAEIEKLRDESRKETAAEGERIRQATARELQKIQAQGEQEIAAAGTQARQELREYAAELAVDLAAKRIKEQMSPQDDAALVYAMMQNLDGHPGVRAS